MGKFTRTYDPKESRDYKDTVAAQIVAQGPQFIKEGAIDVSMVFYLPRPKTLPKKIIMHVKKPDIDNLMKGIFDAMKGIVWADDSQVCRIDAAKQYALEEPGVGITVITGG
jgi:Holliday junction resolvase RusA-like endonuclease